MKKDAWDKFAIVAGVLQMLAWVVCIIVVLVLLSGCTPSVALVVPISESQIADGKEKA